MRRRDQIADTPPNRSRATKNIARETTAPAIPTAVDQMVSPML